MASTTYFSPFFPDVAVPGAKGTTIAPVTSVQVGAITETVSSIQQGLDDVRQQVEDFSQTGVGDTTPPGSVTGLTVTSVLSDNGLATLSFAWNAVSDADLAGYIVAVKQGNGSYIEFVTTSTRYSIPGQPRNTTFTAKVAAYDKNNNRGGFSSEVVVTSASDTIAPAVPSALAVPGVAYNTANITFTAPTDSDTAGVRVYVYNAPNGGGTLVQTLNVAISPGRAASIMIGGLTKSTTYSVVASAYDTSNNMSVNSSAVNFTTAGGISVADFTPGISPISTVANLPNATGYTGPVVVFNQADGRLYRYVGGAWTKDVEWNSVTGAGKPEDGATSGDNLLYNSSLKTNDGWAYTGTATRVVGGTGDPGNYMRATGNDGSMLQDGRTIPSGAKKLFVSYYKRSSEAGRQVAFDITFLDAAGNPSSTRTDRFDGPANTWTQVAFTVPIPANSATFLVSPVLTASPGHTQDITKIRVGVTEGGSTVGAPAGTIVGNTLAETIELRANDPATRINNNTVTIDGGKLTAGTVTANQIASKTITADRIAVGAIVIGEDGQLGGAGSGKVSITGLGYTGALDATRGARSGTMVGNTPAQTLEARANDPAAQINVTTTTISGGKITTGSIDTLQLKAGAVTADKILVGTIGAAQIATGALTARVLAVGDATNYVPDELITSYENWTKLSGSGTYSINPGTPGYAGNYLRVNLAPGDQEVSSLAFPVEPNKQYFASAIISPQGPASEGNFGRVHVTWCSDLKGMQYLSASVIGETNVPWDNTSRFTTNLTAPNNAKSAILVLTRKSAGVNSVDFAEPIFRKLSDSTLIQNGAITTDKINVGTLNGDRISVGTLDADRIKANSIMSGSVTVSGAGTIASAFTSATWAGVSGAGKPADNATVGAPTGTLVGNTEAQAVASRAFDGIGYIEDTRSSNSPPSYYYDKGKRTILEFKNNEVLGITGGGTYGTLTSLVQWTDPSGGPVQQSFVDSAGRTFNRISLNTTNWGAWKDAAAQVNQGITQIDPGRILISGGTSLANWKNGTDSTEIRGGAISANSISANQLKIGNRAVGFIGLNFEWNPANNTVYWDEGFIYYTDENGNKQGDHINPGNTGGAPSHQFFWWSPTSRNTIQFGQVDPGSDDRISLGSWWGGSNLNMTYGGTIINGNRITTGTVSADRIIAGTISATQLAAGAVTATKINVGSLDAITSTIGLLRTATTGARSELSNNGLRVYNENNILVVEIGLLS